MRPGAIRKCKPYIPDRPEEPEEEEKPKEEPLDPEDPFDLFKDLIVSVPNPEDTSHPFEWLVPGFPRPRPGEALPREKKRERERQVT